MIKLNKNKSQLIIKISANFPEIIKDLNSYYSLDSHEEIKSILMVTIEKELEEFLKSLEKK